MTEPDEVVTVSEPSPKSSSIASSKKSISEQIELEMTTVQQLHSSLVPSITPLACVMIEMVEEKSEETPSPLVAASTSSTDAESLPDLEPPPTPIAVEEAPMIAEVHVRKQSKGDTTVKTPIIERRLPSLPLSIDHTHSPPPQVSIYRVNR